MRKGKKALDIVIALILLVFAFVCFFSIYGNLIGADAVQQNLLSYLGRDWGFYVLAILAAITGAYALFLLLRALFTATREHSVRIRQEDGEVYLTESSVESVVEASVRRFHQVSVPRVAVNIRGGSNPTVRSKIACKVKGQHDLKLLARQIQEQVREDLEQYVGFSVGDVEVTFADPDAPSTETVAG